MVCFKLGVEIEDVVEDLTQDKVAPQPGLHVNRETLEVPNTPELGDPAVLQGTQGSTHGLGNCQATIPSNPSTSHIHSATPTSKIS